MNRFFISIVLLNSFLGLLVDVNAQSYVRLDDASGINLTSEDLTVLTNATDSIISLWPIVFEDNFKVFDCGFYLQQKGYVGGYFNYFTSFIQQAKTQSDFYLLFGRGINEQTGTLDYFIDISLPDTGKLSCLSTLDLETLIFKIENSLNQTSGNVFSDRELNGLISLKDFLRSKMKCCFQGNRDENCTQCTVSNDEIEQFTKTIGLQEFTATIGETETDQTKEIIQGNKYYFNNVNKKIVINDSIFLTEAFLKGVTFDSSSNYKMSTIVFNKNTFCTEDLIKISNKIKESNDVLLMIEYDEDKNKFSKYLYALTEKEVKIIAPEAGQYFNNEGLFIGGSTKFSDTIRVTNTYWTNGNTYFILWERRLIDYHIDINNVKCLLGVFDYYSKDVSHYKTNKKFEYNSLDGGNFTIFNGRFQDNPEGLYNVGIYPYYLDHGPANSSVKLNKIAFYCLDNEPNPYYETSKNIFCLIYHEFHHFSFDGDDAGHLGVYEVEVKNINYQKTTHSLKCNDINNIKNLLEAIKSSYPIQYKKYKKLLELDVFKTLYCPNGPNG